MAILDEHFCVVLAPPTGGVSDELVAVAREIVEQPLAPVEVSVDGAPHVVTVSRLAGPGRSRYALLLQPRGARDPVADAVERFFLTAREGEVLDLIVRGRSNREIARDLHIVQATVQNHVRNLCAKTGARRRGDLLARVFGV